MRRDHRRPAAVLTALAALLATTMTAAPGTGALADEPCGLPRSAAVHHSLGLDSWNDDYPRPVGTVRAVMLFLSFPDTEPRLSPGRIAEDYFPATTEYFDRSSYGRLSLETEVVEEWLEMPADSVDYGIQRDWPAEQRADYLHDALSVIAPATDLAAYDVVYLVADPDAPGVDSDATKVVNFNSPITVGEAEIRRLVTVFENRRPDRNVLAHETGHVFDLPDLYNRPTEGSGDWDTHVGDWDLMGSQFGLAPDLFGWHKWKLGWLDPEHVACVRSSGTSLHTLQPLGAPLDERDPAADTRIAVVRTGPSEALVAEARTPIGNDRSLCTRGVLLYRVRGDVASAEGPVRVIDGHPESDACHGTSVHPRLADAPLETGESYVDASSGVRIEVGERTSSGGWHIRVDKE
ncbi:M6 family metalloprotease domain-containing protein [Streptomyces zhaozhouensis]|uniref:M6 family metalloprotease domain-containing protein n=1 Tax=Streptomyces zhaozhouensis TaxID=1300267 RepID=A0A286DQJ1_9ACTN|nr:M6 family metalloprotease domain-containing protein [Streptomyces zhaozhouensis]SOD60903.1 M6 family metalloprotease domain-containing protein [Streptomyces zhaozhouensis]